MARVKWRTCRQPGNNLGRDQAPKGGSCQVALHIRGLQTRYYWKYTWSTFGPGWTAGQQWGLEGGGLVHQPWLETRWNPRWARLQRSAILIHRSPVLR